MRAPTLSPVLESYVLSAVAKRYLKPTDPFLKDGMSQGGLAVLAVLSRLVRKDTGQPVQPSAVGAMAETMGIDLDLIRPVVRRMIKAEAQTDAEEILNAAKDRQRLLVIANRVSEQLSAGKLDTSALTAGLGPTTIGGDGIAGTNMGAVFRKKKPPVIEGLSLKKTLPKLHQVSGGLMKRWVIGGAPGIGKTTLAWQLALTAAKHGPVEYFDLDDYGDESFNVLSYAVYQGLSKKDKTSFVAALKNIQVHQAISKLDQVVKAAKEPRVIFVDMIQALPWGRDQREGLDKWLGRFKELTKLGHTVVMLSELSRAAYDRGGMSSFKETGEIEYAATFAVTLRESRDNSEEIEVKVVKNRHRRFKGHLCNLVRDEDWDGARFKEIAA